MITNWKNSYWVRYDTDFDNAYMLRYANSTVDEEELEDAGYEKITRAKAEKLCAAENRRIAESPAFAGYADNLIYPWGWNPDIDTPTWVDRYIVY